MVVGHVEGEPQGGRQARLAASCLAGAQALHRQSVAAAQLQRALECLGLVAVARDQQRAARQVADIGNPGRDGKLGGEARIAAGAAQPERQQRLLPGGDLGDRRDHPGRDVRGAAADLAALQDGDAQPTLSGAPGDRQTDDPATDHGQID